MTERVSINICYSQKWNTPELHTMEWLWIDQLKMRSEGTLSPELVREFGHSACRLLSNSPWQKGHVANHIVTRAWHWTRDKRQIWKKGNERARTGSSLQSDQVVKFSHGMSFQMMKAAITFMLITMQRGIGFSRLTSNVLFLHSRKITWEW